jgi:hypothetical protein
MRDKNKAAGLRTRAALNSELELHLTARLARTKRLLVGAYVLNALTLAEAELIASRLRHRYGLAWRSA